MKTPTGWWSLASTPRCLSSPTATFSRSWDQRRTETVSITAFSQKRWICCAGASGVNPFFSFRHSDGYIDWFIPTEKIANRTGSWYFGVVSIKGSDNVSAAIDDSGDCKASGLTNDLLDKDFKTVNYTLIFYTSGGYSFNTTDEVDVWEARGM